MDRNQPMIIAMQGNVYTGKTTLANELAIRLKFPTIRLDDILDVMNPTTQPDHPPTPSQLETLTSKAFDLIAQIVRTQTSLGLSIIIDSPLSRLSHLLKLVSIWSDNTRILIIECKPNNEYAWQMRFEEGDSANYTNKWYKPVARWPLPKLPRDYTDDDMPPMVSKLIVNTTDFYMPCHMIRAIYDVTYCSNHHIVEYSSQWNFIHMENHEQFLCPSCPSEHLTPPPTIAAKNEHIHTINAYKQEGIDCDDTLCGVCEEKITKSSGPCYTCKNCPLALHELCAEEDRHGNRRFEPENLPKFLLTDPNVAYDFSVERSCVGCREDGKAFSCECRSCVFESHLKSRLVPTVVRHVGHGHLLTFASKSVLQCDHYICVACRTNGAFVAYVCDECPLATYHPKCVLFPSSVYHNHGGHEHDLEMVFGWEEEMEDYMCDQCHNKMDPKAWYYHCRICVVSLHLECAFKDFD